MQKINNLSIYTDGGARGNPGPAAIGVHAVITEERSVLRRSGSSRGLPDHRVGERTVLSETVFQLSEYIGETTNNVAEYTALIKALQYLRENKISAHKISFFLDSQLIVKQIKGEYKIKQPHLITLNIKAHILIDQLKPSQLYFSYIPRNQNKIADSLVNQALNSH